MRKNISDELILETYKELQSGRKVAEKLNIDRKTVYRLLKKHDITPASSRRYFFNERYFETIDSEERAYWLGFIMADGNIDKYSRVLSIQLQPNDIDLLNSFIKAIGYTGTIEDRAIYDERVDKEIENVRVRLCSKAMASDLATYGIIPNKTGKETVPELDKELIRHFIRGYFDGDGNIFPRSEKSGVFSICGYLDTLELIAECLPVNVSFYVNKNNFGSLSVSKASKLNTLYDYLYKDATIFLERKKNKFERFNSSANQ